jgi:acetyltransferase
VIANALLRDGRAVHVRAVRAGDAETIQAFVRALSWQSRYERFFAPLRELTPQHLDSVLSAPGLSLAAFDDAGRIVALAQYALDAGDAEFALVVAEDWRVNGLGAFLLGLLKREAARSGARVLGGLMLSQNNAMRRLAQKLGLGFARDGDPALVRMSAALAT